MEKAVELALEPHWLLPVPAPECPHDHLVLPHSPSRP